MEESIFPKQDIRTRIDNFVSVMEAIRIGNAEYLGRPATRSGVFLRPPIELPGFDEQEIAAVAFHLINTEKLDPVGLKFEPVWEDGEVVSFGGLREFGHVGPQLKDGERFSSFLREAGPGNADGPFREYARLAVDGLADEVAEAVTRNRCDESVLQTIGHAYEISEGLAGVGLAGRSAGDRLSDYADHIRQGDISEYVAAERLGLLDTSDRMLSSGPAVWHWTELPDTLAGHWRQVIALIYKAMINPRARVLYGQLIERATVDLDYARQEWTRLHLGRAATSSYVTAVDLILLDAGHKLRQIEGYATMQRQNDAN